MVINNAGWLLIVSDYYWQFMIVMDGFCWLLFTFAADCHDFPLELLMIHFAVSWSLLAQHHVTTLIHTDENCSKLVPKWSKMIIPCFFWVMKAPWCILTEHWQIRTKHCYEEREVRPFAPYHKGGSVIEKTHTHTSGGEQCKKETCFSQHW